MLFVRDKGQMCNNILQYGHVYAWGREHGRKTMSLRFAYKYRWFHICSTRWHNFAVYLFAKTMGKLGLIPVIDFTNDYCSPELKEKNQQKMLHCRMAIVEGWLARFYDEFLKYRSEICQLFAFTQSAEGYASTMIGEKDGRLDIGLHIRRGDYKTFQNGKLFFDDITYIHYINDAIRQYANGRKVRVFVCTNDRHLDKDKYTKALSEVEVIFSDAAPDEDLCLLSHCDILVGTVSTFSLVASMYRDLPLCWIDKESVLPEGARFNRFDYLFRHILDGTSIQV